MPKLQYSNNHGSFVKNAGLDLLPKVMEENRLATVNVTTEQGQQNIINITPIITEENVMEQTLEERFTSLTPEEKQQALLLLENFQEQAKLDALPSRLEEIKARYIHFPENEKLTVDNIQAHLKAQLGNDLKIFSAQEDNIYLDELRKIEPRTEQMCQKLKRENYKDESSPLMRDIVPKKTEKVTKRLNNFEITEETTLKEYNEISAIKRSRRKSSNKLTIPKAA